jgi:hypothetical protein
MRSSDVASNLAAAAAAALTQAAGPGSPKGQGKMSLALPADYPDDAMESFGLMSSSAFEAARQIDDRNQDEEILSGTVSGGCCSVDVAAELTSCVVGGLASPQVANLPVSPQFTYVHSPGSSSGSRQTLLPAGALKRRLEPGKGSGDLPEIERMKARKLLRAKNPSNMDVVHVLGETGLLVKMLAKYSYGEIVDFATGMCDHNAQMPPEASGIQTSTSIGTSESMWRFAVLQTREYQQVCERCFGRFVHPPDLLSESKELGSAEERPRSPGQA